MAGLQHGHPAQIGEGAAANCDLAVVRIGERQTAIKIAEQQHFVVAAHLDQPGLRVVWV